MTSHLGNLPSENGPSFTTTTSTSSSSSSSSSRLSPPPAKLEVTEIPSSSSSAYAWSCCYNNTLKLSPPFDSAMWLTVLVLLIAFFFMGFFSIYIRRFADESSVDPRRRRRRGSELTSGSYVTRQKNKGVDPKIVESFPVHAYDTAGGAKHPMECAICLNDFEEKEWVKEIPHCKHSFHVNCIDTWLSTHDTCPLCRTPMLLVTHDQVHRTHAVGDLTIVVHHETHNTQPTELGSIGGRRSTSTCSSFGHTQTLYRSFSF